MLTLLTTLWLCTYATRDVPPRIYSVSYTDAVWAQAEARDACEAHSTTCEFQGCKPWNPGGVSESWPNGYVLRGDSREAVPSSPQAAKFTCTAAQSEPVPKPKVYEGSAADFQGALTAALNACLKENASCYNTNCWGECR